MLETTSNNSIIWAENIISADDITRNLLEHPSIKKILLPFKFEFEKMNGPSILLRALTHNSFIFERPDLNLESYEKLEFLGDAVLETLITTYLFENFPDLSEGDLSKFRGALVNEKSLAELARFIDLGPCILLGNGELRAKGFDKDRILADSFEALIGAIYLDGGFGEVKESFLNMLENYEIATGQNFVHLDKFYDFDSKTQLQEVTMDLFKEFPVYKSTDLGENKFLVEVYLKGKLLKSLESDSKKRGEHKLAKIVLKEQLYLTIGERPCLSPISIH
jgi:ribonuclease-3